MRGLDRRPIERETPSPEGAMQLNQEVKRFSVACEQLLSAIAMNRPLSETEAKLIEYYLKELGTNIGTILLLQRESN